MNNITGKLFLAAVLFGFSQASTAEYVVIVNQNNDLEISQQDIANIFLAKQKTFPNGHSTTPINQLEMHQVRAAFEEKILGKDSRQMKAYWARLIFTGKAVPIKVEENDLEVLDAVRNDSSAIGYIESSKVTDEVRVVLSF